jgi:hypothetical protein
VALLPPSGSDHPGAALVSSWLYFSGNGGRTFGNDDPNRLHRDDPSWLHFATLSEGAQLVRPSVDGGRPAPIADYGHSYWVLANLGIDAIKPVMCALHDGGNARAGPKEAAVMCARAVAGTFGYLYSRGLAKFLWPLRACRAFAARQDK